MPASEVILFGDINMKDEQLLDLIDLRQDFAGSADDYVTFLTLGEFDALTRRLYAAEEGKTKAESSSSWTILQGIQGTKEVALLPCPFCGAAAEVSTGHPNNASPPAYGPVYSVGCSAADCAVDPRTNYRENLEQAITEWNRRTQ